jgi:hypothetical protein
MLLGFGLAAIVVLVYSVGPEQVLRTLIAAGPLFPLILVLDSSWVVVEGLALLWVLGPDAKRLPFRAWLQGTLAHYVTMTVLPVGRAGAEVVRAALFGPYVGKAEAALGAAFIESGTLLANTVVSLICLVAVLQTGERTLALFLAGNATITLVLGGLVYLGLARAGGLSKVRLLHRFASIGEDIHHCFERSKPRHLLGFLGVTLARTVQTLEYGVIILAVSGSFSSHQMLVAQGIHLVGAGLGDLVPNQVGVTEGTYHIFAKALGFQHAPDKAVAVALLARISCLGVAALSALWLQLLPKAKSGPSLSTG